MDRARRHSKFLRIQTTLVNIVFIYCHPHVQGTWRREINKLLFHNCSQHTAQETILGNGQVPTSFVIFKIIKSQTIAKNLMISILNTNLFHAVHPNNYRFIKHRLVLYLNGRSYFLRFENGRQKTRLWRFIALMRCTATIRTLFKLFF